MRSSVPPASGGVLVQLRQQRAAAGLSQLQLAERVGVSRQAVNAIESGRQVPSTTLALKLARALACTVDDLFRLHGGSVVEATVTGEHRGRVVLGQVGGRWVGHALDDPSHTADGVVLDRIDGVSSARVELLGDRTAAASNVLVAGCAPLLGMLAERLGRSHHDARASWIPANSGASLEFLADSRVHIGGIHLAASTDPQAHAEAARATLPGRRIIVVNLACWRQGLLLAPGNPLGIRSAGDTCRPGVRLVCREPGAAAQRLLEQAVATAGHELPSTDPPRPIARRHAEVASLIRSGFADVGVAIEAAALAAGLDFVPLAEERFDLLVPEGHATSPSVGRFVDQIDRPAFRTETGHLRGYDLSTAGHASTVESGAATP